MRAIIVASCLAALATSACGRQESAWEAARREGTAAAYAAYMDRYPAGTHAAEARAAIRSLEDDAAWSRAERIGTPEAWQRYLAEHAGGRHVALARQMLVDFLPPPAPPPPPAAADAAPVTPPTAEAAQDFEVQLGAWRQESTAREALADWQGTRAGLLEGQPVRLVAPSGDERQATAGPPLWRLRAGPLEEAAARSLCERIKAGGADCAPAVALSAGDAPP